ncbi:hypothetical protein D7X74_29145 [Corallococcus sp. CA047B]|uniref:hypothetical protein n=1 Tax=Corallococcus sp. CA047B TaxID=2316729 RepID=UPI000EA3730D|nr:hypothetical protein [Corallococcus sp. CA047B]RKH09656.1 hypothetical protein D7X74_29145 [Corallococcus sp. CA047B]
MRLKPVFAAMALLSTAALADEKLNPIQKEAKASFEKSISSALNAANTACGTKLKVKTRFHLFNPEEWDGASYASHCGELLNGVASMCERPASKKAIARKVTGVACLFPRPPLFPKGTQPALFGALDCTNPANKKSCYSNTAPRHIMLWKGVLTYDMHKDDANIADTTRAVLEEAMK